MKQSLTRFARPVGLFLASGIVVALAACYTETRSGYYANDRVAQVSYQDDYVYYPGYEVYYSNTRHQYVYRDGRSWVTRPEPPRAFAQARSNAVSVQVDFHDTPERHHAEVVKTYPRNWQAKAVNAPAKRDERKNDNRKDDDRRDDDRRNEKRN
jgi:hypothetical protein